MSVRRGQQALMYPGDFATQGSFGTALSTGAVDTPIARADSDIEVEIVLDDETIMDCTGRYPAKRIVNARSSRIAFNIYAEGATLFGWLGLAGGVVADGVATLLPNYQYQRAPTTLIYNLRNSGINALKFKDMVVDSVVITGRVGNRITARIQARGHGGPTVLTGYTAPDCVTVDPLFLKSGAFSLDSVDRAADLREFTFTLDNKLEYREDPFPFNDIDIIRMEDAEIREWSLAATLQGGIGDATWGKAVSAVEGTNEVPYSLRIGSLTDGITIASVGNAIMTLTGTPYGGQVARAELALRLDALRPTGEPSPITITREAA